MEPLRAVWCVCVRQHPHSGAIPVQQFQPTAPTVDKRKHRPALRVLVQLLAHRTPQPVEGFAHVHGLDRHVDSDRRRKREHRLRSQRLHQGHDVGHASAAQDRAIR